VGHSADEMPVYVDEKTEAALMARVAEATQLVERLERILDEKVSRSEGRRLELIRAAVRDFREAVEHHLSDGQDR
jgi:hypothetical protein